MINCVFVTGNLSAKILYELWYLLHFVQLENQKQKRSEWELKVDCRFDLLVIALQRGGARSVLPLS